ncbi:tryptophan transporter [Sporosarcina sp. Marseille-Q4063]|uniref:tryptophan transporter n=1 Tax=Sporosarcina sp. Marseille-Q4063 TaxID=2810514 RepID=UPI001BAF2F81|nr:tryptophan transporter [Sporosarcina sp. Marseille-Q4063]QUW23441.1 tryptophan transporter [Sporosarcina sp. Marseille-Q4063]
MNTKNLVLMAMLVAVGAALYLIIPGINGGMKPDFMLTMMFIGIFLFRDVKSVFILSLATGVLSGLFSTFPLGFLPNIADKLITGFVFYVVIKSFKSIASNLIASTVLVGLGTLLSGFIFLSVAIFILGVELPFLVLYATVVLPAVVLNGIAFFLIKPIVTKILERSSFHKPVAN